MSVAQRPDPVLSEIDSVLVDDPLAALGDSEILTTLGISSDDLVLARSDSDLLETLRIAYEFLAALRDAAVLDTFLLLPKSDQANFFGWIGMTDDPELRRERTQTFVSALEDSPLASNGITDDGPDLR